MNEIMNVNVNELACKELGQNLTIMCNAIKNCKANTWGYAYALHDIMTKKLYEEDFGESKAFFNAYDLKKSTVFQAVNAVKMAEYLKSECGYADVLQYPVATMYLLSTYGKKADIYDKELDVDYVRKDFWINAPITSTMNREDIGQAMDLYIDKVFDLSDSTEVDVEAYTGVDAETKPCEQESDYQKVVKWLDKCPVKLSDSITETIMDMLGV